MEDEMKLTAEEKLIRAKIRLGADPPEGRPFFSFLVSHLKFIEKKGMETMGVDAYGNCYYDPEFVDKLPDNELYGVICHEVCLTPESLVLTSEGLKPISGIKVGDKVYGNKGWFTEVKKVMIRQFEGKVYTIRGRFGLPTTFTSNHPILSLKISNYQKGWGFSKSYTNSGMSLFNFRYIEAKDVEKNDALVFTMPETYSHRQVKIMTTRCSYIRKKVLLDKDTAYFLGFFVGDGSLHRVKSSGSWFKKGQKFEREINLTLSMKDNYERLMQIIKEKFYRSPYIFELKGVNARRIVFSSKSLAKFLRNEFYNNSEKTIPTWMLHQNKEVIEAFVEGLRDSDGCINKGRTSITNTARGVYSFLPLLILKLGYIPAFSKYKRELPNKDAYTIAYETKPNARKTGLIDGNKLILPVESVVESDYKGLVYNLETESHTYCVPYFTVHNCHVALEHMKRETDMHQNHELSNISQDIVVNNILSADGIKLPETGLIPKGNELTVFGYPLKKIDTKCSEEIYDELYKYHKKQKQLEEMIKQAMKGRFDEHMKSKEGDGQGDGEGKDGKEGKGLGCGLDKDSIKQDWKKVLLDACAYAKNRGCVPAGMERIIGKIMEPKVNWRTYLLKFITSMIPTDYTWARPSKRTISTGVYFPSVEKESIEIIAWIDTSGSISEDDLKKFLGELVGITRSFKNVDLTVGVCDCAIHGVFTFRNATVSDVINKIKLKGGGGTSHEPVYNWLKKERPNAKFVICFTDGYTEFPSKKPSIDTLWVVAGENHIEKEAFPFGKVVVVK